MLILMSVIVTKKGVGGGVLAGRKGAKKDLRNARRGLHFRSTLRGVEGTGVRFVRVKRSAEVVLNSLFWRNFCRCIFLQ